MTDLSLLFLTVLKYANNIDYSVKKVLYRKEIKVMLKKEMSLHDYYYDLPEELIAQDPLEDRSSSRLMVLDKNTGEIEHHIFKDIIDYLNPNDCLVINDTKVIPARLYGSKVGTDAKIEVLLLKRKENDVWETLVKPGKKCKPGTVISFGDGILTGEVIDVVEEGNRLIKFTYEGIFAGLCGWLFYRKSDTKIEDSNENVDKEDTDENGKSDPFDATDNKKDDNSGNKDADTGNYIDSNCGSDCSDRNGFIYPEEKETEVEL